MKAIRMTLAAALLISGSAHAIWEGYPFVVNTPTGTLVCTTGPTSTDCM